MSTKLTEKIEEVPRGLEQQGDLCWRVADFTTDFHRRGAERVAERLATGNFTPQTCRSLRYGCVTHTHASRCLPLYSGIIATIINQKECLSPARSPDFGAHEPAPSTRAAAPSRSADEAAAREAAIREERDVGPMDRLVRAVERGARAHRAPFDVASLQKRKGTAENPQPSEYDGLKLSLLQGLGLGAHEGSELSPLDTWPSFFSTSQAASLQSEAALVVQGAVRGRPFFF